MDTLTARNAAKAAWLAAGTCRETLPFE
jgi:hypothetical protein